MRNKILLIAAIDRLCLNPISLTQKIKMLSYDEKRLNKIYRIAKAYEKTHSTPLPNNGNYSIKTKRKRVA